MAARELGRPSRAEDSSEMGRAEPDEPDAGPTLHPTRSRVSVAEFTLPNDGNLRTRDGGIDDTDMVASMAVSICTVCYVDLPQSGMGAVKCTLSPDGRRLAIAFSNGSLATWCLPPPPQKCPSVSSSKGALKCPPNGLARDDDEDEEGDEGEGEDLEHGWEGGRSVDDGPCHPSIGTPGSEGNTSLSGSHGGKTKPLGRPEIYISHRVIQEKSGPEEFPKLHERSEEDAVTHREDTTADQLRVGHNATSHPQLAEAANVLAHIHLLPATCRRRDGHSGDGGGLAVWRPCSNVWRIYHLPPVPDSTVSLGPSTDSREDATRASGAMEREGVPTHTGTTEHGDDSDPAAGPMLPLIDTASLQSSAWILPAPITCSVTCDTNASEQTMAYNTLVAIGTRNGGVYVCDGAHGTMREGMSKHRARITSVDFHGRR